MNFKQSLVEAAVLSGYLKPDLLATIRVAEVERIPNPPFRKRV